VPRFDQVLLAPERAAVVKSLAEAVETANRRCTRGLLELSPQQRSGAVKRLERQPEGTQVWSGTEDLGQRSTVVGLAWWSDHLGRKHIRVAGRRREPHKELWSTRFGVPGEERPPAWLVHPDRLYLVDRPGQEREVVAVCELCGSAGPPARLGWMGPTCGPCHDRIQESGEAVPPALLEGHEACVMAVGFASAAGRLVSLAGYAHTSAYTPIGPVDLEAPALAWDLATGEAIPLAPKDRQYSQEESILALAVAPDGRTAAHSVYGTVKVRDMRSPEKVVEWKAEGGIKQMAFTPDGKALALVTGYRCAVWDRGAKAWEQRWERAGRLHSLACAPGGGWLALGGEGLIERQGLKSPDDSKEWPLPDAGTVVSLAFSPDGQELALACDSDSYDWDRPGTVRTWDVKSEAPGRLLANLPRRATAVAFTPDGRFVAATSIDRGVHFWDRKTGEPAARLEWHVAPVLCLAFSADGETMATGSSDGTVKLWPWRRLVENATSGAR
jgi:hypothetical protein